MAVVRPNKIPGVFASAGTTTIPGSPVTGTTYRDAALSAGDVQNGWPYNVIVNSADFNQILFLYSSLLADIDAWGIAGWSDQVDYAAGAWARGSDGISYRATAASGPATAAEEPTDTLNRPDFWQSFDEILKAANFVWSADVNYVHPTLAFGSDDQLYLSVQDSGPATTVQDPTTDAPGTYWVLLSDAIGGGVASVTGQTLNLSGQYLTASTASYNADEVILKDPSGDAFLAQTVSFTVDITASGVNGLDTGSESSDTWYYVHAIYNGTVTNGLISASPTTPTLPSGYTYSALIGVIRNDASSDFVDFNQVDRNIEFSQRNVFNAVTGVSTYTSISLSSVVPPIAKTVSGRLGHNSAGVDSASQVASSSSGFGMQSLTSRSSSVSFDGYSFSFAFTDLQCPSQTIYWRTLNAALNTHAMSVSGFTI